MSGLAESFRASLEAGSPMAFLLAFAGGVLVSFTPCVYPVLPVTVGYIGSRGAASAGRGFLLSASYDLLWPRPGRGGEETQFLRRHGEFLAGRQQSPVYTNIALAFQEQILPSAISIPIARETTLLVIDMVSIGARGLPK